MQEHVLWYQELGMQDVGRVGGKNASLGEMISNLANAGVQVPGGFATTAEAFNEFLLQSGLDERIHKVLDSLDVDDVDALAAAGKDIRQWIVDTPFQPEFEKAIQSSFETLQGDAGNEASFAVRSSAPGRRLFPTGHTDRAVCRACNENFRNLFFQKMAFCVH